MISKIYTRSKALQRARGLRREQTQAELKLWNALRGNRLQGWKFRRQVPLGNFIADFVCEKAKVIVEVDGATHSSEVELQYDKHRTIELKKLGYRIIRCYNIDVYENLDGVLESILIALGGN